MKDKLFKSLQIKQEKQYYESDGTLWCKHRINPFNPLTYIIMVLGIVIGLLLFGPIGMWRETDTRNPFRWYRYPIDNN
jgi:hypothetical protein